MVLRSFIIAFHVIIIGAGPAGSVAAIRLAQRGLGVTLIERSAFPRDKVCGECVSSLGIEVLTRISVAARLAARSPTTLTRSTTVAPDGSSHTLALPRPMWGVRRSTMDVVLLDAAREAGVDIRQPCTVTGVTAGTRPSVDVRDAGGRSSTLVADVVIVADGKSALLNGRPTPTRDFGLKTHFRDVDCASDTIELVGLGGGAYAGLAPVEGDVFNAAWSVPETTMRRYAGDLDRLFADHVDSHAWLRRSFARATRASDWLTCPLPRFSVRAKWPLGVVPVGNAAAAVEPVGGEGMGLAMRSAELAAEAIAEACDVGRPIDVRALRAQFQALWRVRRLACRTAAVTLSDATLAPLVLDLARTIPRAAKLGLALIGK